MAPMLLQEERLDVYSLPGREVCEMVAAFNNRRNPFNLVVTGEAQQWQPALEKIVGSSYLVTRQVTSRSELLDVVERRQADAAVLDDAADLGMDAMQTLRMIRRLDMLLPVVLITNHADRRMLEHALRLAAFSVVVRPLDLEQLLRQIQRMMVRLDEMLRRGPGE
jgi:DNA-binding NtrC family response regulator